MLLIASEEAKDQTLLSVKKASRGITYMIAHENHINEELKQGFPSQKVRRKKKKEKNRNHRIKQRRFLNHLFGVLESSYCHDRPRK